jgi:hypothetical protein
VARNLREIIVTEQLTSIQQLLVDVKRTLQRQQPPPWAVYSQWLEQQKLLLRVKEVLGIYADLLPRDVVVPNPLMPDVAPQVRPIETDSSASSAQANADAVAQVHDRTNQLINSLDSSLHLTFAALDRDVETYRLALTRKVEQLYELGERSESVVALLLQQVIDEAHEAAMRPRLMPTLPPLTPVPLPAPMLASSSLVDQSPSPIVEPIDRFTSLAQLLPQLMLSKPELDPSIVPESANIDANPIDLSEFTLTGFENLFENE